MTAKKKKAAPKKKAVSTFDRTIKKCGVCRKKGHNARTCTTPPKKKIRT